MIKWNKFDLNEPATWPKFDDLLLVYGTRHLSVPRYVQIAAFTRHKMPSAPPFFLSPMGEHVTHWALYSDINVPKDD